MEKSKSFIENDLNCIYQINIALSKVIEYLDSSENRDKSVFGLDLTVWESLKKSLIYPSEIDFEVWEKSMYTVSTHAEKMGEEFEYMELIYGLSRVKEQAQSVL